MLKDLEVKLGSKWKIFINLHNLIISINPKVNYRVFPIYVNYYLNDCVVAVVYFRGKFAVGNKIDVGFAFNKKPSDKNFITAGYMKCPNINYSIKINKEEIDEEVTKEIKLAIK